MRRSIIAFVVATVAMSLGRSTAVAQSGSGGTARTRCADCRAKESTRVRRERLLLRFDSLRFAFENERLDDAERQRLADDMHRTVIAISESLGDMPMRT